MADPTSPRCPATNTFEVACTCAPLFQTGKLDPEKPRHRHAEQNRAVMEAADVCRPVRPGPVIHGNVDYTGSKYGGGKQELEIAERVEVAEIVAPANEPLVVAPRHKLGAAQAVSELHVEHEAQHLREEHIAEPVEESHRFAFHWVDEAGAIHEVGGAGAVRVEEPRQLSGGHREMGVESREHISRGLGKTEPDGIC